VSVFYSETEVPIQYVGISNWAERNCQITYW